MWSWRRPDTTLVMQSDTDELARFVEGHGITGTFWNRTGD